MRKRTTNCKKKSTDLKINYDHNYVKSSIQKRTRKHIHPHGNYSHVTLVELRVILLF